MASGSTPLPRPSCRPRRTASPATAAGQPVCATPCAVRGSLRGVVARAVWCELAKPQGGWAKQRLLLCTDLDLSAPAVVEAYAQRWAVEPLFAALKLTDGMGAMVAAGPPNAPALAAPGPDRPRTACPADRAGGAGGARASAGRWLAQAGDADAGPGQGRACPAVRRYPGFPPRARNPQENRPCSWSRPARERRRRMTSGSNPRPPPYRSRKRRDQTRTAGAAAPRKLETRVNLTDGVLSSGESRGWAWSGRGAQR